MKATLGLLLLVSIGPGGTAFCAQFSRHKSEAEVARMTPEQRVEEYCQQYARHGAGHDEYTGMIHGYVMEDGLRAVPALTRIVAAYDPTTPQGKSTEKWERFDGALLLLSDIDQTVVRLRASQEGAAAIVATRKAIERMRAAGFQNDPDHYEKQMWYKSSVDAGQRLVGLNWLDSAIGNTLRVRFKIRLTDQELLDFVNYLISIDPHYPDRIGMDVYKDFDDLNEAGYPRQYQVVVQIEPFYKAYLQYKPKR